MSLKVKCFATVIQDMSHHVRGDEDGLIEIHSTLYNLMEKDFAILISNFEKKEFGFYLLDTTIGEGETMREISLCIPVFTEYAYKNIYSSPVPLVNQPISPKRTKNLNLFLHDFGFIKNIFL
jgi:hypothetical protein